MPVRGRGWYKRPHKVRWTEDGRKRTKAFHHRQPAIEERDWLRSHGHPEATMTTEGPDMVTQR